MLIKVCSKPQSIERDVIMALIGYARVSTKDQNLSFQIRALEEAGCKKIFHGKRSGRSKDNDEMLQKLIDYAREGDEVLLTKLDRLGRSLHSILKTIVSLQDMGVSVRTLDGQVNTASESPMQKAMTQLLAMFAELEHGIIVDRLQSGRELTGKKGGKSKALNSGQVKEIRGLHRNKAISKSQLAREYGVSRATIMRVLDDSYAY